MQITERAGRSGKPVFLVRIRFPGHDHAKTCKTRTEAERWATRRESILRINGDDCPECKAKVTVPTWGAVVGDYLSSPAFERLKPSTQASCRYALNFLLRSWGKDKPVDALTTQFAYRHQQERFKDGVSPSWCNRELTYAHIALRHAQRGGLVAFNPLSGFERLKERTRDRVLTEKEADALRAALPVHVKPIFEIAYRLPLRQDELLQLQWSQVDLESKCLRFDGATTKSGRPRTVPFFGHDHLVSLLAGLTSRPAGGGVFLLPNGRAVKNFASIRDAWDAARKTTGLLDVVWHSLKHTSVTNLKLVGWDSWLIEHAADHSSPIISRRYQHLTGEQALQSVQRTLNPKAQQKPA